MLVDSLAFLCLSQGDSRYKTHALLGAAIADGCTAASLKEQAGQGTQSMVKELLLQG